MKKILIGILILCVQSINTKGLSPFDVGCMIASIPFTGGIIYSGIGHIEEYCMGYVAGLTGLMRFEEKDENSCRCELNTFGVLNEQELTELAKETLSDMEYYQKEGKIHCTAPASLSKMRRHSITVGVDAGQASRASIPIGILAALALQVLKED